MAQVSTNEQLVESRTRIGRYASLGGLGIIFAGLIASFNNEILLAYGALIIGFILSNTGAYFLNRWGLHAHEKLGAALKGLDKRYRLYNFLLPVPHVLLTPYGITVFLVKNQDGVIVADEKGWHQGSSLLRLLRAFSTEPLGNPPRDLEHQKDEMRDFLEQSLGEDTQVPRDGYIVFTNPRAQVTVSGVSAPVIVLSQQPDALKNALRRDKRAAQLPRETYDRLVALLEKEADEKKNQGQKLFGLWPS